MRIFTPLAVLSVSMAAACNPAIAQTARPLEASEAQSTLAPVRGLPARFDEQFAHHYAAVNGIRLHYVTGGPANGPMVVLLHGWPQTWYTWRNVMPPLAKAGYRSD
jgi:hypothetical protein